MSNYRINPIKFPSIAGVTSASVSYVFHQNITLERAVALPTVQLRVRACVNPITTLTAQHICSQLITYLCRDTSTVVFKVVLIP